MELEVGHGETESTREFKLEVAEDLMKERFACALYGDALAARPADLHCVRRNAIEVCERALDGLAVDVSPVHESYFQFESKKRLAGFVVPRC